MGGQIRRSRIWRFWGAPIFSPEAVLFCPPRGYPKCCEMLIQHRADLHATNLAGCTALHFAAHHQTVIGNQDLKLLLEPVIGVFKRGFCNLGSGGLERGWGRVGEGLGKGWGRVGKGVEEGLGRAWGGLVYLCKTFLEAPNRPKPPQTPNFPANPALPLFCRNSHWIHSAVQSSTEFHWVPLNLPEISRISLISPKSCFSNSALGEDNFGVLAKWGFKRWGFWSPKIWVPTRTLRTKGTFSSVFKEFSQVLFAPSGKTGRGPQAEEKGDNQARILCRFPGRDRPDTPICYTPVRGLPQVEEMSRNVYCRMLCERSGIRKRVPVRSRFLGRGCDERLFSEKKRGFQWIEPPDSENWKVAVLIPFPRIISYQYSAIGDTISRDAPCSAIGFRGRLCLRYPPCQVCLLIAIGHFAERSGGVAAIACDTIGNTVRQGYCHTCLAIGEGGAGRRVKQAQCGKLAF